MFVQPASSHAQQWVPRVAVWVALGATSWAVVGAVTVVALRLLG